MTHHVQAGVAPSIKTISFPLHPNPKKHPTSHRSKLNNFKFRPSFAVHECAMNESQSTDHIAEEEFNSDLCQCCDTLIFQDMEMMHGRCLDLLEYVAIQDASVYLPCLYQELYDIKKSLQRPVECIPCICNYAVPDNPIIPPCPENCFKECVAPYAEALPYCEGVAEDQRLECMQIYIEIVQYRTLGRSNEQRRTCAGCLSQLSNLGHH